jgi:TonB family protein
MGLKTIIISNSFTSPSGIKKAALGVSLIAHLILFVTLQQFMPQLWQTTELRTYKVDFVRDAIDDIPFEKIDEQDRENSLKKIIESNRNAEETISLDTRDKRYVSYMSIIKKRLASYWGYPREAKEQLMEGESHVLLSLSREGMLTGITVTGSSGHEILDREAVDAIKRSAPFPPFPDSITAGRLNINVTFDYRLTTGKK